MESNYITFHSFNWWFARHQFIKRMAKIEGRVLATKKHKGKYLVKLANPHTKMKEHKGWQQSNVAFWDGGMKADIFDNGIVKKEFL